jgi:hypothetical protein
LQYSTVWINALRVQVETDRHQAAVARALAVAEQAALDAVGAGHQAELRRSDAGAPVVVRVEADHRALAVRQVAAEVLDLVGVDVGRRRFDRCRQVEDDRAFGRGLQHVHHRLAALEAEIEFGGGEGLGAVFEMPVGGRETRRLVAQDLGAVHRDLPDVGAFHAEHDLTPQRRDRVVEVDDRLAGAFQAFERGLDQILARLGQHLDDDVVGDAAVADQALDEVELGGACSGEADFDLLEADFHQQVKEARLLFGAHRIDQRLVAVAQVGREPARRLRDRARGPLAVGQVDGLERSVLDRGIFQHGHDGISLGILRPECLGWVWFRSPWAPPAPQVRRFSSRPRADKSQNKAKPVAHAQSLWRLGPPL